MTGKKSANSVSEDEGKELKEAEELKGTVGLGETMFTFGALPSSTEEKEGDEDPQKTLLRKSLLRYVVQRIEAIEAIECENDHPGLFNFFPQPKETTNWDDIFPELCLAAKIFNRGQILNENWGELGGSESSDNDQIPTGAFAQLLLQFDSAKSRMVTDFLSTEMKNHFVKQLSVKNRFGEYNDKSLTLSYAEINGSQFVLVEYKACEESMDRKSEGEDNQNENHDSFIVVLSADEWNPIRQEIFNHYILKKVNTILTSKLNAHTTFGKLKLAHTIMQGGYIAETHIDSATVLHHDTKGRASFPGGDFGKLLLKLYRDYGGEKGEDYYEAIEHAKSQLSDFDIIYSGF